MKPAVFLDRDGTIIHDRPGHYLRRPGDARFYRGTFEALRLLKRAGFRLVVVSNQSGIGRGLLDRPTLARIHARLQRELRRRGAGLDGIYFCPHHPEDGCRCRKPSPVLARRAAKEMRLSLKGSYVVGDKKADVDLGRALGVPAVLVRTGHGRDQKRRHGAALRPAHEARDILGAARWILRGASALGAALWLALPARPAQASLPPVAISSETVSSPSDLVRAGGLAAPAGAVPWFPEALEYEVKWGVLSMGYADLRVEDVVDFNGQPAYHIVSEARSSRFADRFYKVRDLNESWVSATASLRSLGYQKKLREGSFQRDEWVLYDYGRSSFLSKRVNKDGSFFHSTGTVPGDVQDILSSLYYLRPMPLKVGDEVILDVNTQENWPLKVKVLYKSTVEVPAGRFRCVVVEPFVRQEGIFIQKGRSMKVWLTDDARHLPILLQVDIIIGSISAYLQRIRK